MGWQTAAGIGLSSRVSDVREVARGNAQGSLYVEVECVVTINFARQLKKEVQDAFCRGSGGCLLQMKKSPQ